MQPSTDLPPPPRLAKIGLFAFEGTGHVNPMAALGAALKRRGHTVVFIHLLDMEPKVRAAGLDFIPYAVEDMPEGSIKRLNEEMGKLSGLASLRYQVKRAVEGVRLQLRDFPSILRSHGPFDLLLVDSAQLAPHLVAEHLHIPAITVDLLPPALFESSSPPWIFDWRYSDWWGARIRNWVGNRIFVMSLGPIRNVLAEQRKEWGMPPNTDPTNLWSTRLRLSHMPAALDFPRRSWPPHFHHAGPFTSEEAREQVPFPWEQLTGRPLVYASLGTLNNSFANVLTSIAVAFSTLDVQLVLSTGGGLSPDSLGLTPSPSLILVNFAPQIALIDKAVLVVTHAGINTVLEALLHGRPMIAIPIASDQPGNARRVERLGLGEVCTPSGLKAHHIRRAAEKILADPGYTQRAKAMQAQLRALRGLDKGVELVEGELKSTSVTPAEAH